MLRLIPIIPDFSTKDGRSCTIWFSVLDMSRWAVINPLKHYYHLVLSFKSKSISNFNTQILEKFPADVPLEGTGMDTGPRVPVLNIIREEERREGETLNLFMKPSLHH